MIQRGLGQIRRIGPHLVTTIDETRITARTIGQAVGGYAIKQPLAVLILGPEGLTARSAAGQAMAEDDLARLCPGAVDTLHAAARETRTEDPDA